VIFDYQNLASTFNIILLFLFLQMYISLISLSIDGNLMCTVDVKLPEEELGGLVTLKFWNHGSNRMLDIIFFPLSFMSPTGWFVCL
jgi:hypothetical protein